MSLVEEALLSQRQTWRVISREVVSGGWIHSLPHQPPRRILLFGVGSSYFAAKLIAYSLIRSMQLDSVRSPIPVIACSSLGIGVDVIPAKDDWIFSLSHRGQTRVTLQALEKCAHTGAYIVFVAAKGTTKPSLAQLMLSTSEVEKCEPHTVGMTSAICAVTSLLLGPRAIAFWNSMSSKPNPDLKQLRERIQYPPTVLLGEWEGEWIAREIALKLTEMASLRCPVFSSEEFFHGPQVLTKKRGAAERIWHVSVAGDPREKQIQADYRTCVPRAGALSWVSSLVEMQWLTLALALSLGVNPDVGE